MHFQITLRLKLKSLAIYCDADLHGIELSGRKTYRDNILHTVAGRIKLLMLSKTIIIQNLFLDVLIPVGQQPNIPTWMIELDNVPTISHHGLQYVQNQHFALCGEIWMKIDDNRKWLSHQVCRPWNFEKQKNMATQNNLHSFLRFCLTVCDCTIPCESGEMILISALSHLSTVCNAVFGVQRWPAWSVILAESAASTK